MYDRWIETLIASMGVFIQLLGVGDRTKQNRPTQARRFLFTVIGVCRNF
jgi:hypothetical protein